MKLQPLYEVKLIADGRQHFYEIDKDQNWKPGVTTVLGQVAKPALLPWALNEMGKNVHGYLTNRISMDPFSKKEIEDLVKESKNIYKQKAADAADIGTRVHGAVNEIIHGRNPVITDDIKAGVDGFIQWKESNRLRVELGDTKLGSKLFGYGGSLDFLAFDGNEAIIFDIKTTKKRKDRPHGIYDEACYQLAAYRQAFRETYGLNVKAVYALWLNKEKPEFNAVKVMNPDVCFEAFLAALKLYQVQKMEKFDDFAYA